MIEAAQFGSPAPAAGIMHRMSRTGDASKARQQAYPGA